LERMSEEGQEHIQEAVIPALTILGFSLENSLKLAAAIVIFIASVFLRRYISHASMWVIKALHAPDWIEKNAKTLLELPLSFVTVFGGFILSAHILDLPPELDHIFAKLLETIVNLAIFWFAFQFVDPIGEIWMKTSSTHHNFGEEIKEILCKIVKSLLAVIGCLAILEIWGINVIAFLTGLGLIGAAVAFAAQDTIANLFGSFVVIMDRIFHKNDMVTVAGIKGKVEHFGIRVTQIRKLDTTMAWIPNATLASKNIANHSAALRREVSWTIQLAGNTEEKQVLETCSDIREYLKRQDLIEATTPLVHVTDVSDGTMTIMVYFQVKKDKVNLEKHLEVVHLAAIEVKRIINHHRVSFAAPGRNVVIHNVK